jgi:hypothetical protein
MFFCSFEVVLTPIICEKCAPFDSNLLQKHATHFSQTFHIKYVRWNFISAHPNTLGHTISNYINNTKSIKKLQMHTKVEWDWNNLKNALVNLIRRSCLLHSKLKQSA